MSSKLPVWNRYFLCITFVIYFLYRSVLHSFSITATLSFCRSYQKSVSSARTRAYWFAHSTRRILGSICARRWSTASYRCFWRWPWRSLTPNAWRTCYIGMKLPQPSSLRGLSPRLKEPQIRSCGTETSCLWSITQLWAVWTSSVSRYGNERESTGGRKLTWRCKCKYTTTSSTSSSTTTSSRRLWTLALTRMLKGRQPNGNTYRRGRRDATAGPMNSRGPPAVSDL